MAEQGRQQERRRIETIHRESVKLDNAAKLPPGTWVSRRDGRLYRATANGSLVAVQSRELEEFELLSEDPYEPDESARIMSTRANVRPNFRARAAGLPESQDPAGRPPPNVARLARPRAAPP